jgi:hypothetical protein
MKLYSFNLPPQELSLLKSALARWQVRLPEPLEFVEYVDQCDVAILDSDLPCFLDISPAQMLGVGAARVHGAKAHIHRPLRGFQVAQAFAALLELPNVEAEGSI